MYHPNELIQDIQERLNRMVQDYRTAIEKNKKLETENKSLALSLEEAIKHQETLSKTGDYKPGIIERYKRIGSMENGDPKRNQGYHERS